MTGAWWATVQSVATVRPGSSSGTPAVIIAPTRRKIELQT